MGTEVETKKIKVKNKIIYHVQEKESIQENKLKETLCIYICIYIYMKGTSFSQALEISNKLSSLKNGSKLKKMSSINDGEEQYRMNCSL